MNGLFSWRLAARLAARDVALRYRGSLGGLAWLVLGPLLLLGVYTLVFSSIFRARWHGAAPGAGGAGEFALMVFSGMLLHGFLAECLTRAPTLVLGNVNFVKKTPFPLEVLGVSQLLVALAHLLPTFGVLLVFMVLLQGMPGWTVLLAPLAVAPLALIALGAIWALAALTVYFRDLAQLIGLAVTALFFLSPVLYPMEATPEHLRPLFYASPLTYPIEMLRDLLFAGTLPDPGRYLAYCGVALVCAGLGLAVFRLLRDGFADAL
ncbi:MAG: ABC transporter permease [Pseudomonadota bacterium]